MKNIKEFESEKELYDYFKTNSIKKIGGGSEGTAYLNKNKELIKLIPVSYDSKYYCDYTNIIMDSDIKLDSFIFPKELFILNGLIVGYKENYFRGNIFNSSDEIHKLNIDKLIEAREKIIEDAKIITERGYFLYELGGNILFNNEKLVGIDTLDYKKNNNVTLDENIDMIDYAILIALKRIDFFIDASKPFEREIEKVKRLL